MTNRFDDVAATWDEDEEKVQRSRTVADALARAVPLRGDERLLEYGAATGLLTQALGERVGPAVLADSSAGMRAVIQRKVDEGSLPPSTRISEMDLTRDDVPGERFDLVASVLVLHHIPELAPVLRGFHTLLEPGGHVAIADLDEEDGSFHSHVHDFDGHNGFNRETLERDLRAAGFNDVRFHDAGAVDKDGTKFGLFLAVARR